MSLVKMTDNLVATSAFNATLTYQGKESAVLEVIPVSGYRQDGTLAEQFFRIITADSSRMFSKSKKEHMKSFVFSCEKRIFEEFWDNSNWKTLEGLCLQMPYITCVLYDKTGNVVDTVDCLTYEVLWALQRVEEAFFTNSQVAANEAHFTNQSNKEFKRDSNRQTHKYFLHHRSPR